MTHNGEENRQSRPQRFRTKGRVSIKKFLCLSAKYREQGVVEKEGPAFAHKYRLKMTGMAWRTCLRPGGPG
jgi:hypothetical protein